MKRASKVLRHSSEPDAAMRQQMRTMHQHYTTHLAAFTTFNPDLDAAFGAEWLAAVEAADEALPNIVRVGQLMEDTAQVENVMTQARQAVQTLFYYVGRAFPHSAGRLDQYGRRDYEKARNSQDKMRSLLQVAFTSATRDKAELAAKGYSAAQLAALGALVEQLAATNTTQEVQKGANTEGTDDYVTLQNLSYGFGQAVSGAAKVLFAADASTLALFRLGPGAGGPEEHELTVEPGKTKSVAFKTPLLDGPKLRLRLYKPDAGEVAQVGRVVVAGTLPAFAVTLTSESPLLDVTPPDLGPAGQVLVVQNTGTDTLRVEMTVLG